MVNNIKFIRLLEKARNGRTVTEFAEACEITPGYMGHLLRGLEMENLNSELLMKVAVNSNGNVSYEDLLNVVEIK
jgi:hypothetical protein